MKDLELVTRMLLESNNTFMAIKDGVVIFKSSEKGIKPMYIFATEYSLLAKGASIADRVIGKGAALLCSDLGLKGVYGELVSKSGIKVLESNGIACNYGNLCDYIKNRDKSDYCPIEKMSMNISSKEILLKKLNDFLKN